MEEEMEEFVMEPFVCEETDLNYEFDAARFYDFTRPETDWEAIEAECWFESAQPNPPSRLWYLASDTSPSSSLSMASAILVHIVTFLFAGYKVINDEHMNSIGNDSDSCTSSKVSSRDDNNKGASPKSKPKSPVKSTLSRSSTLMKPTASHLAKQNKLQLRRFQKKLENIDEKSSGSSSVIDSQATKRQKLDAGYLRKVSHLKHQALLPHKEPKRVATIDINSVHPRPKVTIPREPDLATARRAQRHRSKINTESGEHAKSNAHIFKARPLNRKILEVPSLPLPKKSIPQLHEFQVFHLKTLERAMQHTSSNVGNISKFNSISQYEAMDSKRLYSLDASKQEKCATVKKIKARTNNKKLSLASDAQHNGKSQSQMPLPTKSAFLALIKDSKENTPSPLHQAHEVINLFEEKLQGLDGKQYQCGSHRMISEIGPQLYINRITDIC
uniref:TPX2 central domain-containing protein n=1 Tax=Fagus sylvatica TaxID=28930 RepID=A0A2N9GQ42_FAGSY